jgi:cyclase
LLEAGADKVSINSSAVKNPKLIDELALEFGNQFVVVAIDTKLSNQPSTNDSRLTTSDYQLSTHLVHTHGGKKPTTIQTIDWAVEAYNRGAGEILLTSMNTDGVKKGFDLDISRAVSNAIGIPVIASGGAGTMQHFADVFSNAGADAALAASIFHFGEISIPDLKLYLHQQQIQIRL